MTFRIALLMPLTLLALVPMAGGRASSEPERITVPVAATNFVGVSGCAASGCHGGNDRRGVPGSEFTTWATEDPHNKAFAVLLRDDGQRMERLYRRKPDANAGNDELCLKCHAPVAATVLNMKTDGVGCESCHGAAQNWRTTHYLRDWPALSIQEKLAKGMTPTKDLVERVQACAKCHVGEPGMEVDHDLIAAGHPRLTFEYAAYHDLYPKHWTEKDPQFTAKAWAVGRVVVAKNAAALIADRAKSKRWPELADLNCYSCHRGLTGETPDNAPAGRLAGSLAANNWAFAGLAAVGQLDSAYELTANSQPLIDLLNRTAAKPADVAAAAEKLHQDLTAWCRRVQASSQPKTIDGQRMFNQLQSDSPKAGCDWDQATQQYLALAALHRALPAAPPRRDSLMNVRTLLAFPPATGKTRFNSPADFTAEKFRQALAQVKDQ